VSVSVENHGYLPSYILSSAKDLPWNDSLWADAVLKDCTLAPAQKSHQEIGTLDGWGRGQFGDSDAIYYQRSRGSVSRKQLTWIVEGRGEMSIRVSNCRMGSIEQTIVIE
jgi:hypothetical protein